MLNLDERKLGPDTGMPLVDPQLSSPTTTAKSYYPPHLSPFSLRRGPLVTLNCKETRLTKSTHANQLLLRNLRSPIQQLLRLFSLQQ